MDVEEKHERSPTNGSNSNHSDEAKVGDIGEKRAEHDGDLEIQDGHLAELEVDLSQVLNKDEEAEGDWDADTSPFAAVRAVVPETDDPGMPVNTFRAWFLGIVSQRPYRDEGMSRAHNLARSLSSSAPVSTSSSLSGIQVSTLSRLSPSYSPTRSASPWQTCCLSAASTLIDTSTSRSMPSSPS